VLGCRPSAHVVASLCKENERGQRAKAGKGLEVDATENTVNRVADVDCNLVATGGDFRGSRGRACSGEWEASS
jgi:hypothetical protein